MKSARTRLVVSRGGDFKGEREIEIPLPLDSSLVTFCLHRKRGPHRSPAQRVRWGEEEQGSDVTDTHTWVSGTQWTLRRRRPAAKHPQPSSSPQADFIPLTSAPPTFHVKHSAPQNKSPPAPKRRRGTGRGGKLNWDVGEYEWSTGSPGRCRCGGTGHPPPPTASNPGFW